MNLTGKSIRITVMSIRIRKNNHCRQFLWRFFYFVSVRSENSLKTEKTPAATLKMQQVFSLNSYTP